MEIFKTKRCISLSKPVISLLILQKSYGCIMYYTVSRRKTKKYHFFFNRSGLTIVLWMKRNDEKLVFNQLFNPLLIHKRKSNYRPNLLYKTMFNDSGWIESLSFCSSECTQICYRLQTNLNTIINKTYSVSFI